MLRLCYARYFMCMNLSQWLTFIMIYIAPTLTNHQFYLDNYHDLLKHELTFHITAGNLDLTLPFPSNLLYIRNPLTVLYQVIFILYSCVACKHSYYIIMQLLHYQAVITLTGD